MKSRILGAFALGVLAGPMAMAVPLAYDESVSGDIPGSGLIDSVTTTFALDIGSNTVSGTQSARINGETFETEVDPFRFVIPVGAELYSFSISWDNVRLSNLRSGGITSCNLFDSSLTVSLAREGGSSLSRCVEVTTSSTGSRDLFLLALPLSAGTYGWFGTAGIGAAGTGEAAWSVDYTLELAVRSATTAVPEPGTLALLGLGLMGLGLSRRRKAS